MIDPPGHEWNNFTHEANELVTVVEGRMRFTLLDEAFELEPGGGLGATAAVLPVKRAEAVTSCCAHRAAQAARRRPLCVSPVAQMY